MSLFCPFYKLNTVDSHGLPSINPLHCKNSPFVHSSEILVDPADSLRFSLLVYRCALKISPSLLLSVLRHRSWFPVSITKVCLRLLLSSGSGCNFPLTSLSFQWIPLLFPQHNLYLQVGTTCPFLSNYSTCHMHRTVRPRFDSMWFLHKLCHRVIFAFQFNLFPGVPLILQFKQLIHPHKERIFVWEPSQLCCREH